MDSDAEGRAALDRRQALIQLGAAAGLTACLDMGADAAGAAVPVKPSAEALPIWARLNADLSGRPVYAYTAGTVWGFRPQSDDVTLAQFGKRIYGYHSLVVRMARRLQDGGVAIRSQSWTFYADPSSDEITTVLHNPYTAEDVQSAPMAGPAREQFYTADGRLQPAPAAGPAAEQLPSENPFDMRVRHVGGQSWVTISQFSRFQTPGISWFKLEADLMSYACSRAVLEDPAASHVPSTWSHNLVAEWQTWMNMHGAPGHILFKGEGTNIASAEGAPPPFLAAMERYYPGALAQLRAW